MLADRLSAGSTPLRPLTMRAVELSGLGEASVLVPTTRPTPSPGPGELLVKIAATGVCGHDVLARRGKLSAAPGDVLGHEIAGTVVDIGAGGSGREDLVGPWLGQRVALVQRIPCGVCRDCAAGATSQCRRGPGFYGDDIPGGYAEYVVSSPLNTVALPDSIDDVSAAILSCAVGTGLRALRTADLRSDDVVMVTGAGGGVGVHTIQLAVHLGYRVIAVTGTRSKVDQLTRLGAQRVLVSPDLRAVRDAADALGRPRGADAVIEITGGPLFGLSLRALAPRGRLVLVGDVDPAPVGLDSGLTIVKELQVRGSAHATRTDLEEVVSMVAEGHIVPVVARTWPLAQVSQAHAALDAREITGRAVVVP